MTMANATTDGQRNPVGTAPDGFPTRARVVIIGGGVIGTSVAYHLAHLGVTRRRAAGARPAHLRHHLARGRPDGHLRLDCPRRRPRCASTPATCTRAWRPRPAWRPASSRSDSSQVDDRPGPDGGVPAGLRVQPALRRRRARGLAGRDRQDVAAGPRRRRPRRLLRRRGRPGQPGRRDHVAGQGRPHAAASRIFEGVPATGVLRKGTAVTGVRTPYGDIEAECRGQLRRHVGAPARRDGRREHPAAGRRALLPDHRAVRGHARRPAGAGGPVVVRLLPRGGRRADDRPVRGGLRAVEGRAASRRTSPSASCRRTGTGWRRTWRRRWRGSRSRPRSACASSSAARRASRPTCCRSSARRRSCSNYFVAAGLNSIGILTGGGIGRAMAQWIVDGRPDIDITGINIDRLHRYQAQPGVPRDPYGRVARHGLRLPLPGQVDADRARREALAAARPARRRGRVLQGRQRLGGRRTGTRRPGVEPKIEKLSWGRQNWFAYWAAEHRAAREGVILMDMSFMSKFLVQGRDAGPGTRPAVRRTDVDGEHRPDHLHPVAERQTASSRPTSRSPSSPTTGSGWSRRTPRTGTSRPGCAGTSRSPARTRSSTDVTCGYAQINIQGPRSRELMSLVTDAGHVQRGVPVPRRARDRPRLRPRALHPDHLPRRARLRAVHPGRAGGARLRPAGRGRRAVGLRARRAEGAGQPADGEGLPRLRPRHRQHRHRAGGRSRLRGRAGQAGRLHRPGRGRRAEGGRPADQAAAPGARTRPGAADVPRRGGAPRRAGRSATSAPRPTATPSAARSASR